QGAGRGAGALAADPLPWPVTWLPPHTSGSPGRGRRAGRPSSAEVALVRLLQQRVLAAAGHAGGDAVAQQAGPEARADLLVDAVEQVGNLVAEVVQLAVGGHDPERVVEVVLVDLESERFLDRLEDAAQDLPRPPLDELVAGEAVLLAAPLAVVGVGRLALFHVVRPPLDGV